MQFLVMYIMVRIWISMHTNVCFVSSFLFVNSLYPSWVYYNMSQSQHLFTMVLLTVTICLVDSPFLSVSLFFYSFSGSYCSYIFLEQNNHQEVNLITTIIICSFLLKQILEHTSSNVDVSLLPWHPTESASMSWVLTESSVKINKTIIWGQSNLAINIKQIWDDLWASFQNNCSHISIWIESIIIVFCLIFTDEKAICNNYY